MPIPVRANLRETLGSPRHLDPTRNNPALGIMAQRMRRHAFGDSRRRAAAETTRQSCRADIGLTGSSPGNSQPRGCAICHQSRSNSAVAARA